MANDPPKPTDPAPGAPPAEADDARRRSGRASFDSRGNAVWEWQTSTGVFEREVDTARLKDLSAAELKLMETQALKKQIGATPADDKPAEAELRKKRESGFNPYETASTKPPKPLFAKDLKVNSRNPEDTDGTGRPPGLLARLRKVLKPRD